MLKIFKILKLLKYAFFNHLMYLTLANKVKAMKTFV